jgi:truncated hemoglobin YjbI
LNQQIRYQELSVDIAKLIHIFYPCVATEAAISPLFKIYRLHHSHQITLRKKEASDG